jgi:hypothetical protein
MIFVFAFAVSLDQRRVPIGVVMESDGAAAHSLAAAFAATDYFVVTPARDRREVAPGVVSGRLRGFVVIPQDFEARLKEGSRGSTVGASHNRFRSALVACEIALSLMRETRIRRLPVVDADGKLAGVLSLNDLARTADRLCRQGERELARRAQTLAAIGEPRFRRARAGTTLSRPPGGGLESGARHAVDPVVAWGARPRPGRSGGGELGSRARDGALPIPVHPR